MAGKTALVTGANGGLGKSVALELARSGAAVVMLCRDRARGEAALADVQRASPGAGVELLLADLSSPASVREGAAQFLARHERLDILVNSAAVFTGKRRTTPDGLEMMFATNHLGHFLLTNLLLPALKASPPARILHVSAPTTVALDFDDLQGEKQFAALRAFGASKMCNLLFAYELARRLDGTGVTSNALHPGLVRSTLMKEAPLPIRLMVSVMSRPPERAAAQVADLSLSPQWAGQTGQFYVGGKAGQSNDYSRDAHNQRRLWDISAQLSGLPA